MWCFDGNEVYYTMKEAAEMIGVSYWIIQKRFRKGLIEGGHSENFVVLNGIISPKSCSVILYQSRKKTA